MFVHTHTHTVSLQDYDYNNARSGYSSAVSGGFPSPRPPACDPSACVRQSCRQEYYAESELDAYYISGYCPSQLSQVPLLESENGNQFCANWSHGSNCIAQVSYGRTLNTDAEETDV